MKELGIFFTIAGIFFLVLDIIYGVVGHYQLNRDYMCYWSLADKSSTIPAKSENVDKFVNALEKSNFEGKYNTIFFKTMDNNFDYNLKCLKTLQTRLHQIDTMNPNSFQYNTAIQQITQQEQGEAVEMISVFRGIWWKENYFLLWRWICVINVLFFLIIGVCGIIFWTNS